MPAGTTLGFPFPVRTWEKHLEHELVRELREVYGHEASVFTGRHHARYFRKDTTYHVISRTLQGFCLMRPDPWFNAMAAGVIGRAQQLFGSIQLYAFAFLSNHLHLQLRGEPADIARFVGFIKGEISRRLGQRIGWRGQMWDGRYVATALPTADSEIRCFEYILSQGAKESLVARSTQWPGLHVAKQLSTGKPLYGEWLDGTSYGRAKYQAERSRRRKRVNLRDHVRTYEVAIARLPAWEGHSEEQVQAEVQATLVRIAEQGRQARGGKKPLGVKAILRTPRTHARPTPPPPWFEERRKLICWADRRDPVVREYLNGYWAFQLAFRAASESFRSGDLTVGFPPDSYSPSMYRPPPG